MWNVQEQEQRDYEAGMASEAQNAFALSGMLRQPDDSAAIEAALDRGSFVVVVEHPVYCRFTDAILGSDRDLDSEHPTRAAAEARAAEVHADLGAAACEIGVYVLPPAPLAPPAPRPAAPLTDDDLPF
jgi:hypothetical protein